VGTVNTVADIGKPMWKRGDWIALPGGTYRVWRCTDAVITIALPGSWRSRLLQLEDGWRAAMRWIAMRWT
jgi:hypothetical protein